MKYIIVADEGAEYEPSIQKREFKSIEEMNLYVNSNQCYEVIFCGEVYNEYELKPKEVVTKYELKKI